MRPADPPELSSEELRTRRKKNPPIRGILYRFEIKGEIVLRLYTLGTGTDTSLQMSDVKISNSGREACLRAAWRY